MTTSFIPLSFNPFTAMCRLSTFPSHRICNLSVLA